MKITLPKAALACAALIMPAWQASAQEQSALTYDQALRCGAFNAFMMIASEDQGEEDAEATRIFGEKIERWFALAAVRNVGDEESMDGDVDAAIEALVAQVAPGEQPSATAMSEVAADCMALESDNQAEFDAVELALPDAEEASDATTMEEDAEAAAEAAEAEM